VYSFLNSHADTGMLGIYAGISPENIGESLQVIRQQLDLLAGEPISEAELSAAKEYLRGSMYLNAESTDSRMNRLAKNEFLFGRFIPFEEVEEKILAVDARSIQTWFQSVYNPRDVGLLLFGPTGQDKTSVEEIFLAKG
jgi:predicted Zn-dependent peptidase